MKPPNGPALEGICKGGGGVMKLTPRVEPHLLFLAFWGDRKGTLVGKMQEIAPNLM